MKKILLGLILNVLIGTSFAATIVVSNTNDSGAGSLRQATIDAASGDTIRFDPSLISAGSSSINFNSYISLTKNVVIKGLYTSTDTLYFDGQNSTELFVNPSVNIINVVFDSVAIVNGQSNSFGESAGISFMSSGNLEISNSHFRELNGVNNDGGAIYMDDMTSKLTIFNSDFQLCFSFAGGAIYSNSDTIDISYSSFIDNFSLHNSGAIMLLNDQGKLNLSFSNFDNNTSGSGGDGALYCIKRMDISHCSFSNNDGGAIYNNYNVLSVISHCTFDGNSNGSVIVGQGDISYSTFTNNSGNFGGGIGFYTSPNSITNCTFYGNNESTYSAIGGFGLLSIKGSVIVGNTGASEQVFNCTSLGYNVFEDTHITGTSTDSIGASSASVNLGTLQNNGGFGETMLPQYPSILINNGDPSDLTDAQNSPINGTRDIGAAESCASFNTVVESACQSYTWTDGNGQTYTDDILVEHLLSIPNSSGCDSILVLDLSVNDLPIDQNLNANITTLCDTGTVDIEMASSENNTLYWLRDNANDTIVDGPFEGTGSALNFSTGHINQSMEYNVLAQSMGNNGVQFEHQNKDRIEVSDPYHAFGTDLTIEAWIKFDNASTDDTPWIGQSQYNSDIMSTNVWVWHSATGGNFTFYVNDGGSWKSVTSNNFASLDGWHHITTVASTSGLEIYIDGILDATDSGISSGIQNSPNSVLHIGNDPRYPNDLGAFSYHGSFGISEFRIWNSVRTPTEIQNNMSDCLIGNETGLVQYMKFPEGNGTTTFASVGNNGVFSTNMNGASSWIDGSGSCGNGSCALELNQIISITVNQSTSSTLSVNQCLSYTVPSGDESYTSSGTYTDTIPNAVGCDSIITVNLTITQPTSGTDTQVACGSYTWIDGNTYTSSNNSATYTLTNAAGCDSTVNLDLTINPNISLSANATNEMNGNDGAIDLTVTGGSGVYTYDWDNDGTGDNDDSEDLSGLTAGTYTVIVMDDGGCNNTLTQIIDSHLGIPEIESFNVTLFPNPSNDVFNIKFDRVYGKVDIDIFDIHCKLVHHVTKNNTKNIRLNKRLPAGTYFVKVMADSISTSLLLIQN